MRGIIKVIKKKTYIIVPIMGILIFNFILFSNYYFNEYNNDNMEQAFFATCYLDALDYTKNLGKKYVYIDDYVAVEPYIYILLDNKVSPYDYNTRLINTNYNNKNIIYVMNVPENINYDSVYIISNNNPYLKDKFDNLFFKRKEMCDLTVFYN